MSEKLQQTLPHTPPSPLAGEGWGEGARHLRTHQTLAQEEQTRANAKKLRSDMTEAEKKLWYLLRAKRFQEFKFRRQFPIEHYIVDFICLEHRLVIELDGGHHALAQGYDAKRTAYLESQGFRVLRFWNNEILENKEGMMEVILSALRAPLTPALPREGGGSHPASPLPANYQISSDCEAAHA